MLTASIIWVGIMMAGMYCAFFVKDRFYYDVEKLQDWYYNSPQWKCHDCDYPIRDNDDAHLCIDCGGRNFRADS